ncbi:MAG: hypothetical protein QMD61_02255 [Methanobacterium sp.]|nr:hypothetical protein [Methanobacterium sp.]
MAALDIVWLYVSSAFILALIATLGFITLKIGIFSYKVVSESLIAVKRMENNQIINQNPSEATEKLEAQIKFVQKYMEIIENNFKNIKEIKSMLKYINSIESYFKNFRKNGIKNPKYAYIQLFKK